MQSLFNLSEILNKAIIETHSLIDIAENDKCASIIVQSERQLVKIREILVRESMRSPVEDPLNKVAQFFRQICKHDKSSWIKCTDLYQMYCVWCSRNNIAIESMQKFSRSLKMSNHNIKPSMVKKINCEVVRVWPEISYK